MKKTAMLLIFIIAAALVIFTGCERKVVVEHSELTDASTCFTCHGDNDGLILAAQGQWQNSVHASGDNVLYTNRGGTSDCTRCHDHQGFVDFITTGTLNAPYEHASAIHCFTCHAPHTNGNLNLRTDAPFTLLSGDTFDHGEGNLCVNCHHARLTGAELVDSVAVTSSHWGSHHGPQGDLLNGTGGYEYASYDYEESTHKNAVPNACIGCHMAQPNIHDGYKVGGHSWNMVDEDTGTNLVAVCADCHDGVTSYNFPADEDFDHDGNVEGVQTEVEGLLDSLAVLLYNAGYIDEENEPVAGNTLAADDAGALFNFIIIEEDRSEGVHNFKYIVGLLQSSIEYLNSAAANSRKVQLLAAHSKI
jgi:hypothetical protein